MAAGQDDQASLTRLTTTITLSRCWRNKQNGDVMYVGFAKAFDKCDHDVIAQKRRKTKRLEEWEDGYEAS